MNDMIEFKKWMELSTDLSEKSMKNYAGGVKKIEADLLELDLTNQNLFEITSPDDLTHLKNQYFQISENKELDERGKGMYSAAFNKLIEFRTDQGSTPLSDEGIVYILSNPAMPGLVKIGKTNNLQNRLNSLFSTGVPIPFRCVYAKRVKNYSKVESKLHNGLRSMRENPNREFFRIAEDEVINFLEMVEGEDITPREDRFEDKEDEVAFGRATRIGQRFNFEMVGIKIGSMLHFIRDENITCKVISKNKVEFEGSEHSLSSAGLIATNRFGFNWKSVAGPLNWKFEGEILDERRKRYESGDE